MSLIALGNYNKSSVHYYIEIWDMYLASSSKQDILVVLLALLLNCWIFQFWFLQTISEIVIIDKIMFGIVGLGLIAKTMKLRIKLSKYYTNFLHGRSFVSKDSSSSVCFRLRNRGLRRFIGTVFSGAQFWQQHLSFSGSRKKDKVR